MKNKEILTIRKSDLYELLQEFLHTNMRDWAMDPDLFWVKLCEISEHNNKPQTPSPLAEWDTE